MSFKNARIFLKSFTPVHNLSFNHSSNFFIKILLSLDDRRLKNEPLFNCRHFELFISFAFQSKVK